MARRRDIAALGIDAEPHRPLSPGAEHLVCSARERREWPRRPGLWPGVVAFSAKEAAYKALAAAGWGFLDFLDVRLEFTELREAGDDGAWSGGFAVQVCASPHAVNLPTAVAGRWRTTGSLAVTAAVLPAEAEAGWCA